jgi:hypothetical protein
MHQLFEDRFRIKILFGLVNHQRAIVAVVEREVQ